MNKRGRGQRGGRDVVARIGPPAQSTNDPAPPDCPVVLSIRPDGVSLPPAGRDESAELAAESARLRRELDAHARDVEEFVRNQRFNALVTRVLADLNRPDPAAPPLRIRR